MFFLILLTLIVNKLKCHTYEVISNDSNFLAFCYNQHYFFKNNEYFNNLYDGITFIGTNIIPYFCYSNNNGIKIKLGTYLRIFNGSEKFYIRDIYYCADIKLLSGIKLLFGNINGHKMHNLLEPMYCDDNEYLQRPESGIQFLVDYKKIKSDIWLNWQKFILPGDNFKEEFIAGANTFFLLTKNINYNIALLFKHKGGQVETSSAPMQTFCNIGNGISYHLQNNKTDIIFSTNYFQYCDLSPYKLLQYINGYGLYNFIKINYSKKLTFQVGYWYGNCYYSATGEPLYQSISRKYVYYEEPEKNIITIRFNYSPVVAYNVLSCYFQVYYDYKRNYKDYNFGVFYEFNFTQKINRIKLR
ncbi:MAG: hypothetical protein N3A01_05480 [Bacteroidales bacterium]|nr:hypothetical protein [Bacteroidales bacterium]